MSDIVERLRTAFTADQMRAYAAACVAAEREQWREDSGLEKWFPLTAGRLAAKERELSIAHMALTAIRSHWREFGPECGFDETLEEACKVLGA